MNKCERLEMKVNGISNLRGARVDFVKGHGYYLRRDGQTLAWFKTFKVGMAWLSAYEVNGRGNFASLRGGRVQFVEAK